MYVLLAVLMIMGLSVHDAVWQEAKAEGVKKVRVHILLDGRDVPATSAPEYIAQLEKQLLESQIDSIKFA